MATQIIAEPGKLDFYIKRKFKASPELVFHAHVEKDLFEQWFLPKEAELKAVQMDCKAGGSFLFSHNGPGNMPMGFKGVYHEVSLENGIIKTSEFTGLPQKLLPVLEITTFSAIDQEHTEVVIHTLCPTAEYRDQMISTGMKPTLEKTHFLLQSLLDSLKK